MHSSTTNAINSLEAIKPNILNVIPNDQPLNTFLGWNMPSITKTDLIKMINETQEKLKTIPSEITKSDDILSLDSTSSRLQFWQSQVAVNLNSGNAVWVIMSLRDELDRLNRLANSYVVPPPPNPDWKNLPTTD